MMAGLLALLVTLIMVAQVMAGTWTSNNFLYKPAVGARGEAEKAKFDTGLSLVDSRLAKEIWLGDPGGTPGYDTLAHAITSIGSNQIILRVPAGTLNIAADLSFPANITLKPERGALFIVANGKTLTINGSLEAGLYQIFSYSGTGKVVYKGKKYPEWWGAKDDSGTTDNSTPIAAALACGGLTKFEAPNGGYYKCGSTMSAAVASTRIFSDVGAEIKAAATGMHLFTVTANDVMFRGLKLTGLDTTTSVNLWSGIYAPGTKTGIRTGLVVDNCTISGFEMGVYAIWRSFTVKNCTIDNVFNGVYGGIGYVDRAEDGTSLVQNVLNNHITCTFGSLTYARPISLPYHQGRGDVTGNYCRGGGMAIEAVLDSGGYAGPQALNISNNDCDTSISAGRYGVIMGNIIDLAQAPVGRGMQGDFFQAIESSFGTSIIGNIIRNHTNGVSNVAQDQRIIGNYFIDCGDQGAGATTGMGGVICSGTDAWVDGTVLNAIISGNVFNGTKGGVVDIFLNWAGTHTLAGLTVTDNSSYNGDAQFLLATLLQHSKVSGNYIYNACKADNGTQAFGMQTTGATSSVEFLNNTFVNMVVGGYGMYKGIACQAGDIVGFNTYVGIRDGNVLYLAAPFKLLCSQLKDGARWNPKKSSFTMAAANTKTVSNIFVTATSQIRLEPTNAAAATLMGSAKSLYISAKTAGTSFVVTTADGNNAAGTETFNYEIMD